MFGIVGIKDVLHAYGNSAITLFGCGSTAWMMAIEIMPCTGIDEGEFVWCDPNYFFVLFMQLFDAVHEVAVLHLLQVRYARDDPCFSPREARKGPQNINYILLRR